MQQLPDGRYVAANSKEAKAFRAARDTLAIDAAPKDADAASFTPPLPPIGSPKTDPTKTGKAPKTKKEEKADELEDVKLLVSAIFAGVAVLAGSDVYRFSEPECEAVAKPLARIIDRYSGFKKVVQQVSDPIALFSAIAFPLAVKAGAHKLQQHQARAQQVAQAPVVDVRTMQQSAPPPPPHANGQVPYTNVLDRISEGS
jgi:hypothetical protein